MSSASGEDRHCCLLVNRTDVPGRERLAGHFVRPVLGDLPDAWRAFSPRSVNTCNSGSLSR
ncbi:hypothetical protein [Streptomyces scabiei]|uniref:hypothetical protein n=1 Tax=Streptomyces scabiei TaxID=1930 RepID=UPI000B17FE6B|nr:hypothetical protein [Streptomyces scabiei]